MGQADRPIVPAPRKKKPSTNFEENSEYSDLAEKIFNNINVVFDRDGFIDEFDIIPVDSKTNHSPVIHEEAEHKLGLESWCIPYLYTHSYKSFLAIRRKQRPSSSSLNKYGSSKASELSESERIQRGLQLSRTLILLNPELALAWNFRREQLHISNRDTMERELRLISVVTTRKPKSPEAFSYRKWVVTKGFKNDVVKVETISEWIGGEIESIQIPILRYFSNYHAWNYRLWLVKAILDDSRVPYDQKILVLENEWTSSNGWVTDHVSDNCGHHYRQKLLIFLDDFKLGPESQESRLRSELHENGRRIKMYEGHETQWYHRRFILAQLRKSIISVGDPFSEKGLQNEENNFIKGVSLKKSEIAPECSQLNYRLCLNHAKWVGRNFNWNFD